MKAALDFTGALAPIPHVIASILRPRAGPSRRRPAASVRRDRASRDHPHVTTELATATTVVAKLHLSAAMLGCLRRAEQAPNSGAPPSKPCVSAAPLRSGQRRTQPPIAWRLPASLEETQ
ncbi:extensin precursor [Iris pallida]|uniref:Extensin n=1 Tax=Iris pallida TaxID=29817 RepID=A0AAX6IKQ5_IRIPA|nr:extensin precursor [Iris pallida]KAJ6852975.1 extensin precursor [Iris pallida]